MTTEHNCLPNLDNGWRRGLVRPAVVIVILTLSMAFTVALLMMNVSPVVAIAMLAAASGWTIRISRLGWPWQCARPDIAS
jgi:hypothetical protein